MLITNEAEKKKHDLYTDEYNKINEMLNLHQREWIHRDATMWGLLFKYFYATLIVTLLPNIAKSLKLELPNINSDIFRFIGIGMAIAFLYVAIAYAYRLQAVSKTYRNLLDLLEPPYRRIKIVEMKGGKIFNPSLSYILPIIMFLCLIGVAVALLIKK